MEVKTRRSFMIEILKIPVMFITLTLLMFLPKNSYAWDGDHHQQNHGRDHYRRAYYHAPCNPDLTLVTGMDDIDNRVLIAADSN